jgi:hypothetical protein
MYDYVNDLHQTSTKSEEENNNHDDQQAGSTSFFNSPYDNQYTEHHNHRSTLNCSCSRAISGENIIIPENKTRNKTQPKICSLS